MIYAEKIIFINSKKLLILKVIVGIPAYNEEANIAKIIVQLNKITDNILICPDVNKIVDKVLEIRYEFVNN